MAGQERKGKLMARYSIGEIEKLTGIKPHVLRYWEEVIPSLTPQKDWEAGVNIPSTILM